MRSRVLACNRKYGTTLLQQAFSCVASYRELLQVTPDDYDILDEPLPIAKAKWSLRGAHALADANLALAKIAAVLGSGSSSSENQQ